MNKGGGDHLSNDPVGAVLAVVLWVASGNWGTGHEAIDVHRDSVVVNVGDQPTIVFAGVSNMACERKKNKKKHEWTRARAKSDGSGLHLVSMA